MKVRDIKDVADKLKRYQWTFEAMINVKNVQKALSIKIAGQWQDGDEELNNAIRATIITVYLDRMKTMRQELETLGLEFEDEIYWEDEPDL